MKVTLPGFLALFLVALFFSVCSSPHSGDDGDNGSITISLNNSKARWTGASPALDTLGYKIELLSLPAGTLVNSASINPGVSTHTFNNITPGKYGLKVTATYNGYNLAYDENMAVYVFSRETTKALISLKRLPTSGISGGLVLDLASPHNFNAAYGSTSIPIPITLTNY